MSNANALLAFGRETLELELPEASRLPERLGEDFVRAGELLLNCRGKAVVSGIGKSGHIGKKIAATLASTGTPAFFVHPAEALHGDLGMIESRDVMLFISYSGSRQRAGSDPATAGGEIGRAAGDDRQTALAAGAGRGTAMLDISVEREACPMHLAPTSSTVNTLMMGDALAMAVMQARGFNEEDFARSHPGGGAGGAPAEQGAPPDAHRRSPAARERKRQRDGRDAGAEPHRSGAGGGLRRRSSGWWACLPTATCAAGW